MSGTTFACSLFFFFNDTATTEIYTLSLHDALPIFSEWHRDRRGWDEILGPGGLFSTIGPLPPGPRISSRSEEHTSELQSRSDLVCRLLLEKKKTELMPLSNFSSTTRVLISSIRSPI